MVEGGGAVINSLLKPEFQPLIDWLGRGGVVVSSKRRFGKAVPDARLSEAKWHPFGEDVVLCGKVKL